ncbi:MAG TPA: transketolase [Acetobacteraceae bacterium]|jgi:transketolase|nr:transketolase [Acetobacteraceae bacterium]
MAATAEVSDHPNPALAEQAAILARPMTPERRMADVIRALSIDAVERANSGHPGLPLGMADVGTALWTKALKYDAADPHWPDRDRFVLSAGHGCMLLYSLLHLTGFPGMTIDDIKNFRQLHSPAAGHPEYGHAPGIETTTGPLGQGLANAVGMALAERMLAARFGRSLVDHRTWAICGDGDLMEGISQEAISLAGHLQLAKLTILWDNNSISIDGSTDLATSDDQLKRFAASGWAVRAVDGHDPEAVAAALASAMRSKRPSFIACKTIIGFSAPKKAGTNSAHGSPLGAEEAKAAKAALGWTAPPFEVPEDLAAQWREAGARGATPRRAWLKRLARHKMRAEFERVMAGRLPEDFHETIAALRADFAESRPKLASRASSQKALDALVPAIPELVGGSADLTGSNLTLVKSMGVVNTGDYAGRYIHYGIREHAMAAAMSGIALHGGLIPYGGTFFCFTDYMRPALRLQALMGIRVISVVTHDSIGLGEDGPTHQPVEQLASLRAMPGMHVLRPADAMETAECWELALRHADGPSLLVLSRQGLPALRSDTGENRSARGGYVLAEADGPRAATLIATGSEVCIAMQAREMLAGEGIKVAVVSLPCWELFEQQDESWRAQVLGGAPRIGIEAGVAFGWERWLGPECRFIGMTGFGASAPVEDLYRHFGITAEALVAAVKRL